MVKSQETYAVELEAPSDVLKKLREEVFVNINLMGMELPPKPQSNST